MSASPLVTILTPTWKRHNLLLQRCIPSVQAQVYPNREHVVVSDGPDVDLAVKLAQCPGVTYVEMTHHDDNVLWGSRARIAGQEMARGDFIAHLDDDNAWRPNHLYLLIDKLIRSGADFAYSRMVRHPAGD